MKKSLTITLAVLTLGALSVALWYTTTNKTEESASNTQETTAEADVTQTSDITSSTETEAVSVLKLEPSNIASIEVTVGSNTLNYLYDGENWTLEGFEDYALDQSGLNYKSKVMLDIDATRSIKDANLAEYGLDAPSKKATYHLKDGSTVGISLGNLSLDQMSVYAMLDNDPTTVYVVNSMVYNCMIGDINSYRTKELENYESASIHDIIISGSEFDHITLALNPEQNGYSTTYNLSTDDFENVLANTYSTEQLKAALPKFTVNNFVADDVTDLSTYGLDNPRLHLTVNYYDPNSTTSDTPSSDNTFNIIGQADYIWGNTLENGEIAFMKVGDSSVYSMDATFLTGLKETASPFFLVSKYIAMPNINKVTAIDVTFDDASYHMTVDEANQKYSLDDKEMEKDLFKKLYRNICGLTAEIELDEKSTDSTAVATITYTLSDGSTLSATLTPSTNNQYYQTYLNDVLLVGVTKTQLVNLKDTLKAAKAGEEFKDIY